VLAIVRGRLLASGVSLDEADLEACYALAWQGLYKALLDGQEIVNPVGWLVLVTFRRAIEEQRARRRIGLPSGRPAAHDDDESGSERGAGGAVEPDLAAELDDRVRIRHLMEAMRVRLDAREREAAALCYLQGLSRAEAAERMGLSEARMRKLMEGRAPGRPGVAGKVGALVDTVRRGAWCEEQGSLMRALAFGILDPDGERHRLAELHRGECPACRAYVLSLRGLAVALPPVLSPWGLGGGAIAGAGGGALAGVQGSSGAGGLSGSGVGGISGSGVGGLSASGAAGVGAGSGAGGGWLMTGTLGTKLAVGCLLALGVGAGCIALSSPQRPASVPSPRPPTTSGRPSLAGARAIGAPIAPIAPSRQLSFHNASGGEPARASSRPSAAGGAGEEFGPERGGGRGATAGPATAAAGARDGSPSSGAARTSEPGALTAAPPPSGPGVSAPRTQASPSGAGGVGPSSGNGSGTAAEREFLPG